MPKNCATHEGTEKFLEIHPLHKDKKRSFDGISLSAVGVGTYLGNCDDITDRLYVQAIVNAIYNGINFIDTDINYRCQRSERNIASALKELKNHGIERNQIFISSKGGFLPCNTDPEGYDEHVRTNYIDKGIINRSDMVAGCHSMTPKFLEYEIENSLKNLNVDCIDLYYLHNPETQLSEIPLDEFKRRIIRAFELLERKVQEGKIKRYGLATWNGFRQKSKSKALLSLSKLISSAKKVAGDDHHLKAIQLPYNLVMLEAIKVQNQVNEEGSQTILSAAKENGVEVFISAPLMQSQVLNLPARIFDTMPEEASFMQRSLQFVLSTPNVDMTIVGMKTSSHVEENLKILQEPNWSEEDVKKVWKALGVQVK